MLRTAKQLQTEASAFAPCPKDKTAVRAWINAAQAKAKDADNKTVSLGTRHEVAYHLMVICLRRLSHFLISLAI
jgi:hypothetical protein